MTLVSDDTGEAFDTDECVCEHTPGEHGSYGCEVEGCDCPANWEE